MEERAAAAQDALFGYCNESVFVRRLEPPADPAGTEEEAAGNGDGEAAAKRMRPDEPVLAPPPLPASVLGTRQRLHKDEKSVAVSAHMTVKDLKIKVGLYGFFSGDAWSDQIQFSFH